MSGNTGTSPNGPLAHYRAPQVRIVDVTSGNVRLESANPFLRSVKVTQVNTGVSQLAIALNNQQLSKKGGAQFPSWRYNDLAELQFGQRLRVDFKYASQTNYTAMILAQITAMTFTFPAGAAVLNVTGEDLLSLLKRHPDDNKRFRRKHEVQMVQSVLTDSRSGLTLANDKRQTFASTLRQVTHQKTQTYLQFVQGLAERMDYELYVDFADPVIQEPANGGSPPPPPTLELHFRPARSLDTDVRNIAELAWGRDMLSFDPKVDVWSQYTGVRTRVRDPRRRGRRTVEANATHVQADLRHRGAGPAPLDAVAVRQRLLHSDVDQQLRKANVKTIQVSNLDPERAQLKVEAELRKSARSLVTGKIKTLGSPRLRAGTHIEVGGFNPPFDGIYYVTQAVHTFDDTGYLTELTVRRPGMGPPDAYLRGSTSPSSEEQQGATP